MRIFFHLIFVLCIFNNGKTPHVDETKAHKKKTPDKILFLQCFINTLTNGFEKQIKTCILPKIHVFLYNTQPLGQSVYNFYFNKTCFINIKDFFSFVPAVFLCRIYKIFFMYWLQNILTLLLQCLIFMVLLASELQMTDKSSKPTRTTVNSFILLLLSGPFYNQVTKETFERKVNTMVRFKIFISSLQKVFFLEVS